MSTAMDTAIDSATLSVVAHGLLGNVSMIKAAVLVLGRYEQLPQRVQVDVLDRAAVHLDALTEALCAMVRGETFVSICTQEDLAQPVGR